MRFSSQALRDFALLKSGARGTRPKKTHGWKKGRVLKSAREGGGRGSRRVHRVLKVRARTKYAGWD